MLRAIQLSGAGTVRERLIFDFYKVRLNKKNRQIFPCHPPEESKRSEFKTQKWNLLWFFTRRSFCLVFHLRLNGFHNWKCSFFRFFLRFRRYAFCVKMTKSDTIVQMDKSNVCHLRCTHSYWISIEISQMLVIGNIISIMLRRLKVALIRWTMHFVIFHLRTHGRTIAHSNCLHCSQFYLGSGRRNVHCPSVLVSILLFHSSPSFCNFAFLLFRFNMHVCIFAHPISGSNKMSLCWSSFFDCDGSKGVRERISRKMVITEFHWRYFFHSANADCATVHLCAQRR